MWETNYEQIIQEQYMLARRSHISITESNNMAEFERSFYVDLLIAEAIEEATSYENIKI
jgi:hypothetical protein